MLDFPSVFLLVQYAQSAGTMVGHQKKKFGLMIKKAAFDRDERITDNNKLVCEMYCRSGTLLGGHTLMLYSVEFLLFRALESHPVFKKRTVEFCECRQCTPSNTDLDPEA